MGGRSQELKGGRSQELKGGRSKEKWEKYSFLAPLTRLRAGAIDPEFD